MKTYNYSYELKPNKIINEYCNPKKALFIDIETTGLSPLTSSIYLIGAGFYDDEKYYIYQWFAETPLDEKNVINAFFDFSINFEYLIHFNGNMFDIPFIEKRCLKLNIDYSIKNLTNIDIYKLIKPLKTVLGLQDVRQKTLELFLGIYREDLYSGGELIPVYKKYTMNQDSDLLKLLLLHNEEDVLNMHNLIAIIEYKSLNTIDLHYVNHTVNTYTNYNGEKNEELIVIYKHNQTFPVDIKSNNNGIYINFSNNGTLSLRLPVKELELKHFYDDTKNYYYLPIEDMCIHKSVADGVPKENKIKANKFNCYTRRFDKYIPCNKCSEKILFKEEYKSKDYYSPLNTIIEMNDEEFNSFGKSFFM